MNKQAFTFLTLFTLVLFLGVYYVTLPSKYTEISVDQLIEPAKTLIEEYGEKKQSQNEQLKNQNEQVISSSSSTSEQKLEALENNTKLDQEVRIENEIEVLLKEMGFEACFVQMDEQVMRVVADLSFKSSENAMQIMKLINQIVGDDVLVEVSFE